MCSRTQNLGFLKAVKFGDLLVDKQSNAPSETPGEETLDINTKNILGQESSADILQVQDTEIPKNRESEMAGTEDDDTIQGGIEDQDSEEENKLDVSNNVLEVQEKVEQNLKGLEGQEKEENLEVEGNEERPQMLNDEIQGEETIGDNLEGVQEVEGDQNSQVEHEVQVHDSELERAVLVDEKQKDLLVIDGLENTPIGEKDVEVGQDIQNLQHDEKEGEPYIQFDSETRPEDMSFQQEQSDQSVNKEEELSTQKFSKKSEILEKGDQKQTNPDPQSQDNEESQDQKEIVEERPSKKSENSKNEQNSILQHEDLTPFFKKDSEAEFQLIENKVKFLLEWKEQNYERLKDLDSFDKKEQFFNKSSELAMIPTILESNSLIYVIGLKNGPISVIRMDKPISKNFMSCDLMGNSDINSICLSQVIADRICLMALVLSNGFIGVMIVDCGQGKEDSSTLKVIFLKDSPYLLYRKVIRF